MTFEQKQGGSAGENRDGKACPNGRKQQVQRPRGRGGVGPERSSRGQWILEVTAGALG